MADAPKFVQTAPALGVGADYATGTHAAAAITNPALAAGFSHVLGGLHCSYNGGTPNGSITVADGSVTIFSQDLGGVTGTVVNVDILFLPPKMGSPGNTMTVTLSDGGSNVVGKVTQDHWTTFFNGTGGGAGSILWNLDFSHAYNSFYL